MLPHKAFGWCFLARWMSQPTPEKYSPLKKIHSWKIFTPEKYSPLKKIHTRHLVDVFWQGGWVSQWKRWIIQENAPVNLLYWSPSIYRSENSHNLWEMHICCRTSNISSTISSLHGCTSGTKQKNQVFFLKHILCSIYLNFSYRRPAAKISNMLINIWMAAITIADRVGKGKTMKC